MRKRYFFILALFFFGIGAAQAQYQYTVLLNFNDTNGKAPYGDVTRSGNLLYGMTEKGGAHNYGCIFSIDTNGNRYTDRWDFDDTGTNGENPYGSLTIADSRMFGMTNLGGKFGWGIAFAIDTDGSRYKDLYNFGPNGGPLASFLLSGNVLYGMTELGGGNNKGSVFSIDTNGIGYSIEYSFDITHGENPKYSNVIESGNVLYGVAALGGTNVYSDGVIFSVDTDGTGFKVLHNFNGPDGYSPDCTLALSGDILYGTAADGGADSDGVIFSIYTNGSGYKKLHDFTGADGAYPTGLTTLSGSTLYGTTGAGGATNHGVIFSIDTNGSGYTDLFDFNTADGTGPAGGLIISNDIFYGMTSGGGAHGDGVIFSFRDTAISTGTNKLNTTTGVKLYPNPNNGLFTISLSHAELVLGSQTIVEIYNVMGQKVNIGMLKQVQHDYQIDLSTQPGGVYLYRVTDESGELLGEGKFVIN